MLKNKDSIYNSRNYNGVLNMSINNKKHKIYNSRNYNGVLNMALRAFIVWSTIVEIITEY